MGRLIDPLVVDLSIALRDALFPQMSSMGQQWSIDDTVGVMLFDVEAADRMGRIINSLS